MPNYNITQYLDKFGEIDYDFTGFNDIARINNFTKFVNIRDISEISSYLYYEILDGERPDVISNKLYGSPEYYWTFFLLNNHLRNGLQAWPFSEVEMDNYIMKEYDPYMWISGDDDDLNSLTNILWHGKFVNADNISLLNTGNDYIDHLYMIYTWSEDANGNWQYKEYYKIKKYDYDKFGIIVENTPSLVISYDPNDTPQHKIIINKMPIEHGGSDTGPIENLYVSKFLGEDGINGVSTEGIPELSVASFAATPITQIDSNTGQEQVEYVDIEEIENEWVQEMTSQQLNDYSIDELFGITEFKFKYNQRFSYDNLKNATYRFYISPISLDQVVPNDLVPENIISNRFVISQEPTPGEINIVPSDILEKFNNDPGGWNNPETPELQEYKKQVIQSVTGEGIILNNNGKVNIDFLPRTTFEDYEKSINEVKRNIKVIRPELVAEISREYFKLIGL